MKAIRVEQFGEPEVLQLRELPDLQAAAGQVLVHIHAIGVNPVDTYVRAGRYARLPELPYTPGDDAAGVVAGLGEGVTGFKKGDAVYVNRTLTGAYADQALCLPEHVFPLPDSITFAQGAALGVPYGTAYRALFHRGGGKAGETVLIHGATGGVGTAAIQLARAAGLTVIASAGSEEGRDVAHQHGAHHVLDHAEAVDPARIQAVNGGQGVDLLIEMLANENLGKDLAVMAPRGRVVVVGSRGPVEIDPRATMGSELDIRGLMLYGATPAEEKEMRAAIGAGLENGTITPVVGQTLRISDAAQAHRDVMAGGKRGKLVLIAR